MHKICIFLFELGMLLPIYTGSMNKMIQYSSNVLKFKMGDIQVSYKFRFVSNCE